jgi:hypothetical protein
LWAIFLHLNPPILHQFLTRSWLMPRQRASSRIVQLLSVHFRRKFSAFRSRLSFISTAAWLLSGHPESLAFRLKP